MFSRFGLWLLCAFVVWNVAFDRYVAIAAHEFTREQVIAHQNGQVVRRIDDALRPRVRSAALGASAWGGGVLVAGVLLTVAFPRPRPQATENQARSERS